LQPNLSEVYRRLAAAMVLLCSMLAAAGCGGSSKPEVCGKRDALRTSVDNLLKVNPVSDGMSEVRSRLADVQKRTSELASAAGDQFAPQVDAMKQSTAKVADDLKALGGTDKSAAVSALSTDVPAVRTSYDALLKAVGSVCD
jgi:hypothetical protein